VPSEIERKFLIAVAPDWLGDHPATRIEQGYLAIDAEAEVRLRRAGGALTLTVKRGGGEVREEVEVHLGPGEFGRLWPLTEGRRLAKTRHVVPLGDRLRAEVDVYEGSLAGLVTAEVEFESRARSRSFRGRKWMGEEVTGDAGYSNQSLAALGRPGSDTAADDIAKHEIPVAGQNQGVSPEHPSRAYRLTREESAGGGLRRIAVGRAEKAVERLREAEGEDLAAAIHGARKDLKKLRAVLRLVRADLGEKRFRAENRRFRDAGRLLSASRDAEVKLETLSGLEERFGGELPVAAALAWNEALSAEREAIATATDDGCGAKIAAAAEQIEAGGARIPAWKLKHASWKLIEPGLDRSYREGRTALRRARKSRDPDSVHEFRKRAKDLWYELRLLAGSWPGPLEENAAKAHQLSELLGDHHDLAVLAEDLEARVGIVAERDAIRALIERRQEELLDQALGLGERLYAEKPKHYRRRLHAYWRIWRPDSALADSGPGAQ
jgi:CYTH domain-containing protein/CHAD domain-containing protein